MESGAIAQLRRLPTFVVSLAWRSYLKKLQSDPLVTKVRSPAFPVTPPG